MNQRFLFGVLVCVVGCSSDTQSGDGSGETGGSGGSLGAGGFGGATAGQVGAGGGSSGASPSGGQGQAGSGDGGAVSTATGGSGPSAGGSAASGGNATTGGSAATGGNSATGGNAGAGGNSATGGNAATGGSAGAGGTAASGGASGGGGTATGGHGGTGGAATGGAAGSGGTASGGTGGAGTGGAATGGSGGMPATGESVLERNKHPSRDGYFVQAPLTLAAAAKMAKDTGFNATFSGAMWASPLYMENGPNGKGVFFAVTTSNNVYALDETTGAQVWMKNIGASPTANGVPCGSIHPLGILSTPVIDATTRTIYVAGAIGTTSIARHEVHALSVDDGTERTGFPVVVSAKSGNTTFTPAPQNQRSALSLVNGTLYVAYGGHVGDCGNYHGWVIGIDTKDPTKTGGWATLGVGEGIWASGGMASDGNGVFAVTGNSTVGASDHMSSDSEQVVRITGLGVLTRTNANLYFPASWQTMDGNDQDFASASPVYISVPGATPSHLLSAVSKDGHLYLLDPANLGGMAGHLVDFVLANGDNSVHTALGAYATTKGTYVMLGTDGNAACPSGGPTGKVVMAVHIPAGAPPKPTVAWCAQVTGSVPGPIATSTDGTANAVVWFMNGSRLIGVDGDTGKSVFAGGAAGDTCTGVEQWTSAIAAKGRVVVAADNKLCSWSPH